MVERKTLVAAQTDTADPAPKGRCPALLLGGLGDCLPPGTCGKKSPTCRAIALETTNFLWNGHTEAVHWAALCAHSQRHLSPHRHLVRGTLQTEQGSDSYLVTVVARQLLATALLP